MGGLKKANGNWGWVGLLGLYVHVSVAVPTKDLLILFGCYPSFSSATVYFVRKIKKATCLLVIRSMLIDLVVWGIFFYEGVGCFVYYIFMTPHCVRIIS